MVNGGSGRVNSCEGGIVWGLIPTKTSEKSVRKGNEPRLKALTGGVTADCSYEPPGERPEEGQAEKNTPICVFLGLSGGPADVAAPLFKEPPDSQSSGTTGPQDLPNLSSTPSRV